MNQNILHLLCKTLLIFIVKSLISEKIQLNKDSRNIYREWAKDRKLALFYEPWWLDAVCGTDGWQVFLSKDPNGDINGICPVYRSRLKGIPVHRNPDFTPYSGVFLVYPDDLSNDQSRYSFENKTTAGILEQLPDDVALHQMCLHPQVQNAYPFIWKGFHQTTRYTYILEDIADREKITAGLSQTLRRQIRQAAENHVITETHEPEVIYRLLTKSLAKQGVRHRITFDMISKISQALLSAKQGKLLIATDKNNHIAASMILAWDHEAAYCLALGMDHEIEQTHASKLLIFESIMIAGAYTPQYDFEGSMVPNVERIYRAFGGKRTAYHQLTRFKNRWIKALWFLFK